jgi:hypothetical protein
MVMPCSRSAARPSTSSAKSIAWPCVPTFFCRFQRGQLILEDHLGIIEQPPDQRGLAIVHRPAGDEAQHRLVLMGFEIGVDVFGDQRVGDVDRLVRRVARSSEIPLLLLHFHARAARILVDGAALALAGGGEQGFLDHFGQFAVLSTAPVSG